VIDRTEWLEDEDLKPVKALFRNRFRARELISATVRESLDAGDVGRRIQAIAWGLGRYPMDFTALLVQCWCAITVVCHQCASDSKHDILFAAQASGDRPEQEMT